MILYIVTLAIGNLLPFGEAAGDERLRPVDDGASSAQVKMNIRCPYFGQDEDIIYVC